jgi:mannitol operon transcriptional antiterminator
MQVRLPLDSRQERIARALLATDRPVSMESLAAELSLTDRVIRYNLPSVETFLSANGLRLVRRPGVGVWAEGPPDARSRIGETLDASLGPAILTPGDRQDRILLGLLRATPGAVSSETFERRLDVSRPTIRRDIREVETWLERHRMHLRRLPGVGIAIVASEVDVRAGLLAAILQGAPPRLLRPDPKGIEREIGRERVPSDLESLIRDLDLPVYWRILAATYPDLDPEDQAITSVAVYLAIVSLRVREGHAARLASGRLRSLTDHPAFSDATRIAGAMHEMTGVSLGRADVASITETLLGQQLIDQRREPEAIDIRAVDRILEAAAARLDPSLAADDQLRTSLVEHLGRLGVRIRFGLPINNPLQDEVRRRYPDVYRVAEEVLAEIRPTRGSDLPSDEIGLLTMYLAGSLERLRLRPKVRVTVVCPAGMATAWILVSRLLAEFPQLDVVRVVSKAGLHPAPDQSVEPTELVITTIPLDDVPPTATTVVVSPLLREGDVRRISKAIEGLPA